jgi:hypothetical protein
MAAPFDARTQRLITRRTQQIDALRKIEPTCAFHAIILKAQIRQLEVQLGCLKGEIGMHCFLQPSCDLFNEAFS